jgi:hypothetical protein
MLIYKIVGIHVLVNLDVTVSLICDNALVENKILINKILNICGSVVSTSINAVCTPWSHKHQGVYLGVLHPI